VITDRQTRNNITFVDANTCQDFNRVQKADLVGSLGRGGQSVGSEQLIIVGTLFLRV
jgi:hypothetical protein